MRNRKFEKRKASHRVFLVICEGEMEKEYIELLKRHYRLPVAIKTKVSGNKINRRLVAQYMKELGVGSRDECKVFFVYDADVVDIVGRLTSLDGNLILSNPCIELWYLLHVRDRRSPQRPEEMAKVLASSHPSWKSYHKGCLEAEQSKFLIEQKESAIDRPETIAA